MREPAINIFIYGDGIYVHSLGYCLYTLEGSYEDITAYLQSRVAVDHEQSITIALRVPAPLDYIRSQARLGLVQGLFVHEGIVPEDAIYVVTHIIDGKPVIDEVSDDFAIDAPPDYLKIYWGDTGLDLAQLLADDYFDAFELLWSHQKYISALKLMLSMVDTLGFVEFGPVSDCFVNWLDKYCDMEKTGVTSRELWELRNSLLHMSNLDSNKVRSGTVERLKPVIVNSLVEVPPYSDGYKNFHLAKFSAMILPQGIDKWIRSYDEEPTKLLQFITRYDTTVSEARMSVVYNPLAE